jgi:hypothetical protein
MPSLAASALARGAAAGRAPAVVSHHLMTNDGSCAHEVDFTLPILPVSAISRLEGDRASSGKGDGSVGARSSTEGGGGAGSTHEGGSHDVVAQGRDEGSGGGVRIHTKAVAASGVGGEPKVRSGWESEIRSGEILQMEGGGLGSNSFCVTHCGNCWSGKQLRTPQKHQL